MSPRPLEPAQLASHVPGRIRVRLGARLPDSGQAEELRAVLEDHPGVHRVRFNPRNRSLTVHYDPGRHTAAGILGLLEDADVLVESLTHPPGLDRTAPVAEAVDDLNRRIRRYTRLPVDLRVALPLAFAGAGAWSIARYGLGLNRLPGWMLLWVGVDLFVKLRVGMDSTETRETPAST